MGVRDMEREQRTKRSANAAKDLADLINKYLDLDVTPDDVRYLIANHWVSLSAWAHTIHRDIERGFRP